MKIYTILILIILAGCSQEEEVKSVKHYQENNQERENKIKECKNNAGEKSVNCANAFTAQSEITRKTLFGKGLERRKTK